MVSPINRYACGAQYGTDVTEEQCTAIPYCCYNEIDSKQSNMTHKHDSSEFLVADDEAQDILGDANADASSIPACYYNVFFVFYSEFRFLTVHLDDFSFRRFEFYSLIGQNSKCWALIG